MAGQNFSTQCDLYRFTLLKLIKYWLNITSDKKYPLRICSDIKQDKG